MTEYAFVLRARTVAPSRPRAPPQRPVPDGDVAAPARRRRLRADGRGRADDRGPHPAHDLPRPPPGVICRRGRRLRPQDEVTSADDGTQALWSGSVVARATAIRTERQEGSNQGRRRGRGRPRTGPRSRGSTGGCRRARRAPAGRRPTAARRRRSGRSGGASRRWRRGSAARRPPGARRGRRRSRRRGRPPRCRGAGRASWPAARTSRRRSCRAGSGSGCGRAAGRRPRRTAAAAGRAARRRPR